MLENTDQKTPNQDTYHAVKIQARKLLCRETNLQCLTVISMLEKETDDPENYFCFSKQM